MSVIDQIIHAIQASIDELLGEVDRLRHALAALGSHESESEPTAGDHAAPASGPAAGQSPKSTRAATARAPRTRTASIPPQPPAPASSAAAPARARTAQGATKAAVLAALEGGSAMTASEIAAATGLGRASVSTTLSRLASSGEVAKAARGYQLERESETTPKPARRRPNARTVAEPQAAEVEVAEPQVAEVEVAEPQVAEVEAAEPQAAEVEAAEPQAAEVEAAEPQAAEVEVAEPQAAEVEVAELEVAESQAVESKASGPARSAARSALGATKHAVLAVLADGGAMTAGEVASATGLARGSVSATLSQLAKAGEVTKAARGYELAVVEEAQRFYFRAEDDTAPGEVVANLPELEAAIAVCVPGVLREHGAEHDFSRWVAGVLGDESLAAEIAAAEAQLSGDSPTETVEEVRVALIAALQARYATRR